MGAKGPRRAEELAEEGFALLREGDFEAALKVAVQLEALRYSAAFDIAAQAYGGLGNVEKATETLERGVREAPESWLNWQLLGNYRSDLKRYDEAARAYERALACRDARPDSIFLNQGILLTRRGQPAQALIRFELVKDPALASRVAGARVAALEELGDLKAALLLTERTLADRDVEAEEDAEALAFLAVRQGRIRLELGMDKDDVRKTTMDAIASFGSDPRLLHLIRDIDSRFSPSGKYFRLLIRGTLPAHRAPTQTEAGYFVTYDVVAESQEEASACSKDFEKALFAGEELRVDEVELLEERPGGSTGVYACTGRCFYDEEGGA